jgi:Secretion system C-terminal sorting domain
MKKILLILMVILGSSLFIPCSAQFNTYHPFPDSSAWWSEEYEGMTTCSGLPSSFSEYSDHFLRKDTIMNGLTYHMVYYSGGYGEGCGVVVWNSFCNYIGSIREDSMKHIYFNSSATHNRDTLLYDFNLNVGDTLQPTYINNPAISKNYVKKIDSILIGTRYRKQFIVTDINDSAYWRDSIIEGIGSNQGLFGNMVWGFESYSFLLCFEQNDTTIYPRLNEGCQIFVLGVPDIEKEKANFIVYPNPNNGDFTVTFIHPELVSENPIIQIYNILGEQVYYKSYQPSAISYQPLTIDLSSQPNGVYFCRVVSENNVLLGEGKVIINR